MGSGERGKVQDPFLSVLQEPPGYDRASEERWATLSAPCVVRLQSPGKDWHGSDVQILPGPGPSSIPPSFLQESQGTATAVLWGGALITGRPSQSFRKYCYFESHWPPRVRNMCYHSFIHSQTFRASIICQEAM